VVSRRDVASNSDGGDTSGGHLGAFRRREDTRRGFAGLVLVLEGTHVLGRGRGLG